MSKAAEAFKTISEVAGELDVPKHVLRFWEAKFTQVRPMKRGGGRRFYRPADVDLLRGICALLHSEGYTIKGVQKILREHGVEDVKRKGAALAPAPRPGESATAVGAGVGPGAARASEDRRRGTERRGVSASGVDLSGDQRRFIESILSELEACRTSLLEPVETRSHGIGTAAA